MTPDDATLMAYADGELDPLAAKRVERAMAANPALADAVAAHRALRAQVAGAFAPVADAAVPDRLTALLASNVVPFEARSQLPGRLKWTGRLAIAASLLIGIALGTQWPAPSGPVAVRGRTLVASGALATALDTQLAAANGDTRIAASFRDKAGDYCRVFAAPALDGIACRTGEGWQLRQTSTPQGRPGTAYRQAGTPDASLMAAAQEMMAGDPLDAAAEARARAAGWR